MLTLPVAQPFGPDSFIDAVELDSCGLLRLVGWHKRRSSHHLRVNVNGADKELLNTYAYSRPDVLPIDAITLTGFCSEYDLGACIVESVRLYLADTILFVAANLEFQCNVPHYNILRQTKTILGRSQIYGYGPPNESVSPQVLHLVKSLKPPILDFGCGMGALVASIRSIGKEIYGLELNRPEIVASMLSDIAEYVRLYDGSFPIPFAANCVESVVCSEVLEHIADYEGAIKEIARVCRSEALFTVPDIGVIPLLHKYDVVPWHLLEATHVNFFTAQNLAPVLSKFFKEIEFGRIGCREVNGTRYWETLVAWCSGRKLESEA